MPGAPIDKKLLPRLNIKISEELDLANFISSNRVKTLINALNNIFDKFPSLINEFNLPISAPQVHEGKFIKHHKYFTSNLEEQNYFQAAKSLIKMQILFKNQKFEKISVGAKATIAFINLGASILLLQSNQPEEYLNILTNSSNKIYINLLLDVLEENENSSNNVSAYRSSNFSLMKEIGKVISYGPAKDLLAKLKASALEKLINQAQDKEQEDTIAELFESYLSKNDIEEILKLIEPQNSLNEFLLKQRIIALVLNKFNDRDFLKIMNNQLVELVKLIDDYDSSSSDPEELLKYLDKNYQTVLLPYNRIVTYRWNKEDIEIFKNNYLKYSYFPEFLNRAQFAIFAIAVIKNDIYSAFELYPKIKDYSPGEAFGYLLMAKLIYRENINEACEHVHMAYKNMEEDNYQNTLFEFENPHDSEIYTCVGLYQLYYVKNFKAADDYIKKAASLLFQENKDYENYKANIEKIIHSALTNDWQDIIDIIYNYLENKEIKNEVFWGIINNFFDEAVNHGSKNIAYKIADKYTKFLTQTGEFTSSSFYKLLMQGDLEIPRKLLKNENVWNWLKANKVDTIVKGNHELFEDPRDKELYNQLKEAIGVAIDYYGLSEIEIAEFLKNDLKAGYISTEIFSITDDHMYSESMEETELEGIGKSNIDEIEQ